MNSDILAISNAIDTQQFDAIFWPAWQIIINWWWLPTLFLLWRPFLFFWKWWRQDVWFKGVFRPVLLEIKLPKDVVKPIRAMESVIASIHGAVYHPPDWWEEWVEGQYQTAISFEIASLGGETHFFMRFRDAYRDSIETAIYSQYPEAEIREVEDYTKYVPQDIPNKEWDMMGFDYQLIKESPYPIKTYSKFETEREVIEEKIIDPIADLLEGMAKIKLGEHLWLQIRAVPLGEDFVKPFQKEGKEIRDKLARRPKEKKPKPIIEEVVDTIITGPTEPTEKKEEIIPPEMKLTPGERETLAEVERKTSKLAFKVNIRCLYLGKRDTWFKANFRIFFTFFNYFAALPDLNALYPWGNTFTKIHKSWFLPLNLLIKRRHYLRCRRQFRFYKSRLYPLYPRAGHKGLFVLNTEEMASLYHFPSALAAPAPVSRLEAKKGEAPPGLPIE